VPPPVTTPPDEQILKLEENKQRWSWLALRNARDQHLALFAKIGVGDIALLAAEIEREREARENAATQERGVSPLATLHDSGSRQSLVSQDVGVKPGNDTAAAKDTEGDVKMEA